MSDLIVRELNGISKSQLKTLLKNGQVETKDGILKLSDLGIYLVPEEENTVEVGEVKIVSGKTEDGEHYIEFVFPDEEN